jgi:hypothetical protein
MSPSSVSLGKVFHQIMELDPLKLAFSLVCQIYNVADHMSIVCPRIEDIKPKCSKCGLSHKTKTMDSDVGIAYVWDIRKIDVRRRARKPNHIQLQITI